MTIDTQREGMGDVGSARYEHERVTFGVILHVCSETSPGNAHGTLL